MGKVVHVLGRPRSLERCKPNPNQPRTGVSWARLFMCVDVLGIVGEVNEHQHQPQTGISWASLVMCVDVLDIVGEVSQSQNHPQRPTRPQTGSSSAPNLPNIERKHTSNRPQLVPQTGAQIDSESTPNRPQFGPKSARNRSQTGPESTPNRPQNKSSSLVLRQSLTQPSAFELLPLVRI